MNIALLPLQRWTSTHTNIPASAAHLRSQIDMAAELDCCAINVCTSDKLNYLNQPTPKNEAILAQTANLHAYAALLGLETTQSGPLLLKHHGLARRMFVGVRTGSPTADNLHLSADVTTKHEFPELAARLQAEDPYRVIRLKVLSTKPAVLFLHHPSGSVMQKAILRAGQQTSVTHINLPGLTCANLSIQIQEPGTARITFLRLTRNELNDGADEHNLWFGTSTDGFLHCRAPKWNDIQGLYDTCCASRFYLPDIPHVVCADELNSPFGHDLPTDSTGHPGGWPQWLAEYLTSYCFVTKALTGQTPLVFLTDPVKNVEELRCNRYCAPVPAEASCDYLRYVHPATPLTIGLWAEGAPAETWDNLWQRADRFNRTILIYAGRQNVRAIADGIGLENLRNALIGIFYWEPERPDVPATVRELKTLLES